MKKSYTPIKKQLMLLMAALFLSGAAFSQNTTITDVSTHTADASAVLDVYSNNYGMLLPRLGTAPSSPATGLLYYSTVSNSFFYNAGTSGLPSWTELSYGKLWSRTGTDTYLSNLNDNVVIGTNTNPSGYKFYVYSPSLVSQQSRFDGQVEFWNVSGPTPPSYMDADINDDGTGNGVLSVYSQSNAKVRLESSGKSFFTGGNLGIGTTNPNHLLHLDDINGTNIPQLHIDNSNASQGNVSIGLYQTASGIAYSFGIFDDPTDFNFKICQSSILSGPGYGNSATMMEIHNESQQQPGIIDFNHQSRARVFQMPNPQTEPINPAYGQLIPHAAWTMVNFDMFDYDEHLEWALAPNAFTGPSYFVATETGYYQVNSRVDFELAGFIVEEGFVENAGPINNPNYPGYVSIAIYVSTDQGQTWTMYAQGNKLQGADNGVPNEYNDLRNNLAPNVSDVVELEAGNWVAIYVWQNLSGTTPPNFHIPLRVEEQNGAGGNRTQVYVSIHKVS